MKIKKKIFKSSTLFFVSVLYLIISFVVSLTDFTWVVMDEHEKISIALYLQAVIIFIQINNLKNDVNRS